MPVRQCEYLLKGETELIGEGRLEVAILQRVKLLQLLWLEVAGVLKLYPARLFGFPDVLGG